MRPLVTFALLGMVVFGGMKTATADVVHSFTTIDVPGASGGFGGFGTQALGIRRQRPDRGIFLRAYWTTWSSDVTVGYTVASVTGAVLIASSDLTEEGRATPDTGSAIIDETVNAVALHADFTATVVSKPSDSATFSAVALANVTDHLRAAGGIIGTVAISGFSSTFDEAPEPVSALMLLRGLTGIAMRRT